MKGTAVGKRKGCGRKWRHAGRNEGQIRGAQRGETVIGELYACDRRRVREGTNTWGGGGRGSAKKGAAEGGGGEQMQPRTD